MLFNSYEFFIFLPIVFFLYWFVFKNNLKFQNTLILLASYVFYSWWDWRFLSLIIISTIIDYLIGLKIYKSNDLHIKRYYLLFSIIVNLGILGFFKYYNFFIDSWIILLNSVGYYPSSVWTLNVILPVGISFYTFQTMSYSLDIYYNKLKPTRDIISFAAFVSFFPQLVAGPIERASNLIPQILNKRTFKYNNGVQGLRLILWGMFKKVVVADSLSLQVDYCFNNYHTLNGGLLFLGLIYFSFQIYCDFSGYSDIAIGTAKLFGIDLMKNFKYPYFSRNVAEFWRRWHISLSTWFRDYMYIPLGGSKMGKWITIRNIFIIFIISGFWHGANWTFIAWGLCHAIIYIPLFLSGHNRIFKNNSIYGKRWLPSFTELFQMATTFLFVTFSWVFFRSENIVISFKYLFNIITKFSIPFVNANHVSVILLLLFLEWTFYNNKIDILNYKSKIIRICVYILISNLCLINIIETSNKTFIYFQF